MGLTVFFGSPLGVAVCYVSLVCWPAQGQTNVATQQPVIPPILLNKKHLLPYTLQADPPLTWSCTGPFGSPWMHIKYPFVA